MMTIREIESGSDIMEVNRLAGLIWHEAYRGIVSRTVPRGRRTDDLAHGQPP